MTRLWRLEESTLSGRGGDTMGNVAGPDQCVRHRRRLLAVAWMISMHTRSDTHTLWHDYPAASLPSNSSIRTKSRVDRSLHFTHDELVGTAQ